MISLFFVWWWTRVGTSKVIVKSSDPCSDNHVFFLSLLSPLSSTWKINLFVDYSFACGTLHYSVKSLTITAKFSTDAVLISYLPCAHGKPTKNNHCFSQLKETYRSWYHVISATAIHCSSNHGLVNITPNVNRPFHSLILAVNHSKSNGPKVLLSENSDLQGCNWAKPKVSAAKIYFPPKNSRKWLRSCFRKEKSYVILSIQRHSTCSIYQFYLTDETLVINCNRQFAAIFLKKTLTSFGGKILVVLVFFLIQVVFFLGVCKG